MNNDFLQKVNEEILAEDNSRFTNPDKMELTAEVKAGLIDEILELHHEFGYDSTTYGVEKIVDTWWENKGRYMTQLFGNHPNYVPGKFQIVFDSDYNREIDSAAVNEFLEWIRDRIIEKFETYTKREAERIGSAGFYTVVSNEYPAGICISGADCLTFNKIFRCFESALKIGTTHLLEDNASNIINEYFTDIRSREGQKKSRVIGKICKTLNIDKHADYNREYAKLCDAVNPLNIVRHTIISWNPVDYYTMSFGNSWSSCHTIDKENKRGKSSGYSGCFSGGTISYMLDEVSVVFYTVDKNYDGRDFELQDKINRCMFHISRENGFFVQGRVYPQDNDGSNSVYKSIREIMQKIIADSWGVENLWGAPKKGEEYCRMVINHCGKNYADYFNYSNCNVSLLKGENIENVKKINVGHDGICPCCGREHDEEETITCYRCYNKTYKCECCGYEYSEDNLWLIDGYYYCADCCSECSDCGERMVNDNATYVRNYGNVCDRCLESGDYDECAECGEWIRVNNLETVIAEDGTIFCDYRCAESSGYVYVSETGEYVSEDECVYCSNCGEYVLEEDFDFEEKMCNRCIKEMSENQDINFSDEPIRLEDIA